jgi:hypothetical protein
MQHRSVGQSNLDQQVIYRGAADTHLLAEMSRSDYLFIKY